jgi:two-component system, cell cycle sensor histidine kinase and response regulator CckA
VEQANPDLFRIKLPLVSKWLLILGLEFPKKGHNTSMSITGEKSVPSEMQRTHSIPLDEYPHSNSESNVAVLKAEIQQLKDRIRHLEGLQPQYREFFAAVPEKEMKSHHPIAMGTWVWDTKTNAVQWSNELFAILGYDSKTDKASVENYLAAIHPDDKPVLQEAIGKAMSEGVGNRYSVRVLWPNGQCRQLQQEGMALRNEEGEVIRMLGFVLDVTEFAEHQEKSQRAQQLLQGAQLLAKVGSWIWNIDEGWLELSDGAWRLAGLPPKARISLIDSLNMIHPDDVVRVRNSIEKVVNQPFGGEIELEYKIKHQDGSVRQILQRSCDLPHEPGMPRLRLGTVLDVTSARLAEDQIRQSLHLLGEAQALGKVGHWVLELASGTMELSESLCDMIGRPGLATMPVQELLDMVHPSDADLVRKSIFSQDGTGGERRIEFRICLADGEIRQIVQRSRPYFSSRFSNGEARLGTMVDVSDLRRAEARSKQAQSIAESALKLAKAGSWLWDPKWDSAFWSDELYRLSGVKIGTPITQQYFNQIVHPEDRAAAKQMDDAVQSRQPLQGIPFRIQRPDNHQVRHFEMYGQWENKVEEDGQVLLGINIDVTERRLQENAKRQDQKLEAIGRLAGGVAHDFNNLLTVILGHAEELNSQKRHERLEQILKAGTLGAALTQRLLAFSRQAVVRPQNMNLSQVILGMRDLLERLLGEDVLMEFDLRSGASQVTADIGQVEQIILNLAINARDAMPEGGRLTIRTDVVDARPNDVIPKPSVDAESELHPYGFVTLRVEDNGLGMSQDVIEHLFVPFFTTKELGKGTGLGLSTILTILTEGNGSIRVESQEGQGTRFEVYWPRIQTSDWVETETVENAPQMEKGKGVIGVVEDNPELRRLLVEMLESGGYGVMAFSSGQEAVDSAAEKVRALDLLVTDMVMPGIPGQVVAQSLRLDHPGLPVLFISGYPRMDMGEDLQGGFLQKPFTRSQLLETVGALIAAEKG